MKSIEDLPNDGAKVLLMRRTGDSTVKTDVGYRDAHGCIRGWFCKAPPTHWVGIPPWGGDSAATFRKLMKS